MAIAGTFDVYELNNTALAGGNNIEAVDQDDPTARGFCVRFGSQAKNAGTGPCFVVVCGGYANASNIASVGTRYAADLTPADLVDYVPARRGFTFENNTLFSLETSDTTNPNYAANRAKKLAYWQGIANMYSV